MTFLYLDASAWVKRYYRERGSDRIHELLSGEDPRVCSVLGRVEVIATLARKRKAQEITPQDFDAKVAEIERDWQSFVQIELTLGTLDQAKDAAPAWLFAAQMRCTSQLCGLCNGAFRVPGTGLCWWPPTGS